MDITTDNIEEWCFRYLEKDLNANEQLFFETELTSNKALQKEYALWKKTKIKDLIIDVPTHLNISLLRYNTQFIWLCIELSVVLALSIVSMCYHLAPAIIKYPIPTSTNTSIIIIDTAEKKAEVNTKLEYINRVSIRPIKKEMILVTASLQSYIDSSKQLSKSTISEEHVSPPNITLLSDSITIKTLKDSTVKNATLEKTKTTNRKRNTGSRLIPINNDL